MTPDTLIREDIINYQGAHNEQKQTRKQYPRTFKEEAVALVTEQGYSAVKAAEAVGVTASLLYKWKDALEAEKSGAVLNEDEREELKRLRKGNRELSWRKKF